MRNQARKTKETGNVPVTDSLRLETNIWRDPAIALMATYAGRAVDLGDWMKGAQINTDRNMRLQYLAGMAINLTMREEILDSILEYYEFPEDVISGSPENIRTLKMALQAVKRTS